jgi:hypothetical protein
MIQPKFCKQRVASVEIQAGTTLSSVVVDSGTFFLGWVPFCELVLRRSVLAGYQFFPIFECKGILQNENPINT